MVDLHWDPKLNSLNFVLELEWPESSRAGTDAARTQSEQREPSEPNGEPVWTAMHIRHAKILT